MIDLDFNEYILTKGLTWVLIFIENENRWDFNYDWEIFTRIPILNEKWKYTMIIKIIWDNVSDLILSDENTKIVIIFQIKSEWIRIPNNCVESLWNNTVKIVLRSDKDKIEKEIWIKNKRSNWVNLDNFISYSLEKVEEKDEIGLCVDARDNNPMLYEDKSLIERYNRFENVDDFCSEFIKVNPMFWENRNQPITTNLWWNLENLEILCRNVK